MNRIKEALLKWNFKKIALGYIIVTLIAAIGCATAAGIVFRDRISFAWQYSKISLAVEKSKTSSLTTELDRLAAFPDVIDVLVLDNNNNVTYSAKKSEFGSGSLNLSKASNEKNYLISDKASDVIFKYVSGEEFMFSSVFNKDFGDIKDEYEGENFYENGFSSKTVYMLGYIGEKGGDSKVYIINNPTSVTGGMMTLKISACTAMLFFMIYWVLLALWVYQNAANAGLYPLFWGIIVLFTNIAGVIVYKLYIHENLTCPVCGASQNKSHIYCFSCGEKLSGTCAQCGEHISAMDVFCPHCGKKLG